MERAAAALRGASEDWKPEGGIPDWDVRDGSVGLTFWRSRVFLSYEWRNAALGGSEPMGMSRGGDLQRSASGADIRAPPMAVAGSFSKEGRQGH